MGAVAQRSHKRTILAVNCGSSSLKFGLYAVGENETKLLGEGEAEQLHSEHGTSWFRLGTEGEKEEKKTGLQDARSAFRFALNQMQQAGLPTPDAIGHRIVHGGLEVRDHVLVDEAVLSALQEAAAFAPLHVPPALEVVREAKQQLASVAQAACLDTAFHRCLPDVSRTLPLPTNVRALGVERFGFHGLSMESIVARLDPMPGKLVVAHLGGGCSVTAIHNGQSVDNSMGLTPTGGIMMGSRPGDLDPGILTFLIRKGFGTEEHLSATMEHQSGLIGVSETTSDMRELLARRAEDKRADLALRMFSYSVRKGIAAMAAALGGMDLLVFTGGIGEHSHEWRDELCSELAFLGKFAVKILPAQEDLMIANITARLSAVAFS